ncbi:nuclear transport factor 2 family protein [Halorussus salinus]|uniref:nuclear transport factor 2 family protein n=1 Tax=Halorussus salinus TaxID=1364935 RepID=UPI001092DAA8|nr:nuclear transport factor 2 family protein [Halorussus salinus]
MTDATEPGATDLARAYYEAIDAKNFERFADLLGANVVHERPDRTFEGRETLVEFVRDGRPNKDTSHEIEAVYVKDRDAGKTGKGEAGPGEAGPKVAVRGRLRDAGGNRMFGFVDAFEFERDGGSEGERRRIARIRTYTN